MLKLCFKKTSNVILFLLILTLQVNAQDTPIQKVEIAPLDSISFSTVTLDNGWVTCPTVEFRGRKEIIIQNTDTTDTIKISSISGNTTAIHWTLYPRQWIKFKASSDNHLYMTPNTADYSVTVEIIEMR